MTSVPSTMSPRATTLKATGRVLLDLQCGGRTVHTNIGDPVRINSPGCSDRKSPKVRSARMSDVIFVYASWSRDAADGGAELVELLLLFPFPDPVDEELVPLLVLLLLLDDEELVCPVADELLWAADGV